MPDTTAVVACFNYGAYLPEAVASLLRQEGGAPHVVVVDDGSTDPATQSALDALPAGVEVVRQRNTGVCGARNAGLARARTPFLLFLDADDCLRPGALAALRTTLAEHPSAGFAYGHHEFFGAWSGIRRLPPYDPLALLDRHLIGLTGLVRSEVLAATGGFDPAFSAFEDWELWVSALAHGWHGVRADIVALDYRRHAQTSKLGEDRRAYRAMRRRLRRKHAVLYARRRELAADSRLGPLARLVYRGYWGPRPVPAALEAAVYDAVFSRRGRSAASAG